MTLLLDPAITSQPDQGDDEPMSSSDPFTNGELVRWLERVEEGQTRIEHQVERIADDFSEQLQRYFDDHEARIRNLERVVWYSAGLAGAGIVSGLGALITTLVGAGG